MPTTPSPKNGHHRVDLTGRRILVVEDDRLNARIISAVLEPEGFVVAEAGTGEEALAAMARFKPDLILLDVVLPGINGFETCRRLKLMPGVSSVPVIFITSLNQSDDIVEGLEAGGVDYVVKPFKPREALARIRAHLNIRALGEQQVKLIDDLSRANAAKNHFLGIAAHDIRNPLTSLRGLSEHLLDGAAGEINEEQRATLKSIHNGTQVMLDLLNELLDISVIESGELRLDRAPVNFADLIQETVAMNSVTAARKQTRLQFLPARPRNPVFVDAGKMRQVVDNLLSNAIKFSPPGSMVTVALHEEPGRQILSIRDQGPGVAEAEMGQLFQAFGKTSAKPTGGEKSTGLGLAICRKIVDAHGGIVSAANVPGGGADFRVILSDHPHAV